MFFSILEQTPVGPLLLAGDESGLKYLHFGNLEKKLSKLNADREWEPSDRKLKEPVRQLKAYFRGSLRQFDIPLAADGTEFQKRVWNALCGVPFGQTASYREIAIAVGQPTASRAVGMANGRNPIPIIVPCHRIIGSSGKLVGYGGGLQKKEVLLQLEGVLPQ